MIGDPGATSVTVWLQSADVPQSSVARQVRVTSAGALPLVTVLRMLIVTLLPQQVVNVGGVKSHADPASTTRLLAHCTVRQASGMEIVCMVCAVLAVQPFCWTESVMLANPGVPKEMPVGFRSVDVAGVALKPKSHANTAPDPWCRCM